MGSGNSRLGGSPPPTPPRRPKVGRTKHHLSSFFCGTSSISSSSQREDCEAESLVNFTDCCHQLANVSQSPTNGSISTFTGITEFTSHSNTSSGPGSSPESSSRSIDQVFSEMDSHIESSSERKNLSEIEEIVSPDAISAESKDYQHRQNDTVSTPCTGQLAQVGLNSSRNTINNTYGVVSNDMLETSPELMSSSSLWHEDLGLSSFFEETNEVTGNHNIDYSPIPAVSDPGIVSQYLGDEAIHEAGITQGIGFLVPDRAQVQPEGSLLHVDVVNVSSNESSNIIDEVSTRETRRNSRRMFWDAFSSRNSRRHGEFPAILLTTQDADFTGSHRRWLLDIGDEFFDDAVGPDSLQLGRRSHFPTGRRRNSRSEFWDRLRGAANESRHRASCPLDLHPDGSCTCELDEEASALSSISRIVLLAEALFEVLDEIHRQPDSFSLPMLSVPAPETVVDSLPLRTYEKPCTTGCGEDVDQCYICLAEYEEGDKIRVLPCRHEYHMSCVDKWLKEIHGICPLCRGEVRGEDAASSSDAVLT